MECCQGTLNPYTYYILAINYTDTASAGTYEREARLASPDVHVEMSVASDPRIIVIFIYNFCRVRNQNPVTVGSLVCFCSTDVGRHFRLWRLFVSWVVRQYSPGEICRRRRRDYCFIELEDKSSALTMKTSLNHRSRRRHMQKKHVFTGNAVHATFVFNRNVISLKRRVLNVVCFLLGNSSASEFYMPTFRNTLFHLHRQVGE